MILRTRTLSWAAVSPLRRARGLGVRRAVVTITLEPTDTARGVSTRGIPQDAPAGTGLRAPRGAVPGVSNQAVRARRHELVRALCLHADDGRKELIDGHRPDQEADSAGVSDQRSDLEVVGDRVGPVEPTNVEGPDQADRVRQYHDRDAPPSIAAAGRGAHLLLDHRCWNRDGTRDDRGRANAPENPQQRKIQSSRESEQDAAVDQGECQSCCQPSHAATSRARANARNASASRVFRTWSGSSQPLRAIPRPTATLVMPLVEWASAPIERVTPSARARRAMRQSRSSRCGSAFTSTAMTRAAALASTCSRSIAYGSRWSSSRPVG